jgi:hypothetical protein
MVDYKGGHLVYNNTERIRCASRNNCRGLIDTTAPLWEQARTVAVRQFGTGVLGGFFEKGDFIRWRELALTYTCRRSGRTGSSAAAAWWRRRLRGTSEFSGPSTRAWTRRPSARPAMRRRSSRPSRRRRTSVSV